MNVSPPRFVALSRLLVACLLLALTGHSESRAQGDFRVTLLGTGSPAPTLKRFGPSTLVEAGNQKLLFDAGRGATIRLNQLGIPIARIDALFLTHFHSDHTVGIPDLWLTGWIPAGGLRARPFHVVGPTGIRSLISSLELAYAADIRMRAPSGFPMSGVQTAVSEFGEDGIVYQAGDVKVTAFEVDHGPENKPAFGYRIDYGTRSVLISGDTRFNENLIRHGRGVDLLVHEVASAREELTDDPLTKRVLAIHTSPREAGEVFRQTHTKLAAYTHVLLRGTRSVPAPTIDQLVAQTRKTYDGPLQVGEDLMSFEIGDAVMVRRYQP